MDGAGDIPAEWAEIFDIKVIPINIHFKEKRYLQGIDLSNDEFYNLANQSGVIPKTSQPTPQQFIDFYERIAQAGDTILSIHVTSKLSGTFDSALIAARELKDRFNIFPFDSGAGSAAMGYMAREARVLERAGIAVQGILERLDFIRRNVSVVLTLDNLDYARMSGRVKALQAALASMLNVKPIVILRDGVLDVGEKVRTRQRSITRIFELIRQRFEERLVDIAVVHAQAPEIGHELLEHVKKFMNYRDLILTDLSIGVAANLGPGTVGIVAYQVEGE
jgi:DegV family protein with EDD domain